MKDYVLTVFEKNGNKVLDQTFSASSDQEAKEKGINILEENNYSAYTHRCVTSDGKLILFSS